MDSIQQLQESLKAIIESRKKPQFILAMDAAYFKGLNEDNFPVNGINVFPFAKFLYDAQPHLAIREREALEKNPHYRQLLPYLIVKYPGEGFPDNKTRYATYRRTHQGGEAGLHNRFSIGYGGHVDISDLVLVTDPRDPAAGANVLDLNASLLRSARREAREEFRAIEEDLQSELDSASLTYANKFIVSDRGVDNVHLAVIIELVLPVTLAITCQGTIHEHEHADAGFLTAEEALAVPGEMESWSKLYLESELHARQ